MEDKKIEHSPSLSSSAFRRSKPMPLSLKKDNAAKGNPETDLSIKRSVTVEKQDNYLSQEELDRSSTFRFKLEELKFLKQLGSGSSGNVVKVMHEKSGQIFAKKTIPGAHGDAQETQAALKRLSREVRLMRNCASPHIVNFYGAILNDGDVILLMEFMDLGSLDFILKAYGPVTENVSRKLIISCLEGLHFLHQKGVVHRDIKPSNILLNSQGEVKISDFGISRESSSSSTNASTFTGTQGYLAPERITNIGTITIAADIWSLGLSLIELVTGVYPYQLLLEGRNENSEKISAGVMDLYEIIIQEPSPTLPSPPFSLEIVDFLTICLDKNPVRREIPSKLLKTAFCEKKLDESSLEFSLWLTDLCKQV